MAAEETAAEKKQSNMLQKEIAVLLERPITKKYIALLKNKAGVGLGCFLGGLLLGITLSVEPDWFLKRIGKN